MWNHNFSEWLKIFDCFLLRFKRNNNNNKKNGGEKGQDAQIYNGQRAPAFGWTAQSSKRAFQIFSSKFSHFFLCSVFRLHIMVNVWILTTHFMETSKSNVKEHDLFTYLFIFSNRTFGILVITIISNLDNIIFKKFKYEKYWNVIIVCIMHHIRNAELLMSHLMLSMKFLGI